jgi:Protein of unknown function (DUF3365)
MFFSYLTTLFKDLKLSNKFNMILLIVFLSGVIAGGSVLSEVLMQNAENQISGKADLLMKTMISVRAYTQEQINPELESRLELDQKFLSQTVPGYSAREVFENLRANSNYQNFFYKEATLNPTNLRDKSDSFETKLVNKFRADPDLREQQGYRSSPGGSLFYTAQPLKVEEESCLRCHSTPTQSPLSLRKDSGGWSLTETEEGLM